ncbi:MAG TPA: hypothetical protein VGJ19_19350, partial [Streptosporangiaceae bacterium]
HKVQSEIERARTGQAMAALITAIALGAAIYFFAVNNRVAGGVMLSVPVITSLACPAPAITSLATSALQIWPDGRPTRSEARRQVAGLAA